MRYFVVGYIYKDVFLIYVFLLLQCKILLHSIFKLEIRSFVNLLDIFFLSMMLYIFKACILVLKLNTLVLKYIVLFCMSHSCQFLRFLVTSNFEKNSLLYLIAGIKRFNFKAQEISKFSNSFNQQTKNRSSWKLWINLFCEKWRKT